MENSCVTEKVIRKEKFSSVAGDALEVKVISIFNCFTVEYYNKRLQIEKIARRLYTVVFIVSGRQ